MSDVQRLLPRLALCCLIFMMRDVFVDKYSAVTATKSSASPSEPNAPHMHNDQDQAVFDENKYAKNAENNHDHDDFDFDSAANTNNDDNLQYEVFEEEEDDEEYISPKSSSSNLGKDLRLRFQICTS